MAWNKSCPPAAKRLSAKCYWRVTVTIFLLVPGICPQATGLKIHCSRISGVRPVTDLSSSDSSSCCDVEVFRDCSFTVVWGREEMTSFLWLLSTPQLCMKKFWSESFSFPLGVLRWQWCVDNAISILVWATLFSVLCAFSVFIYGKSLFCRYCLQEHTMVWKPLH